jgi:hypothetical protein
LCPGRLGDRFGQVDGIGYPVILSFLLAGGDDGIRITGFSIIYPADTDTDRSRPGKSRVIFGPTLVSDFPVRTIAILSVFAIIHPVIAFDERLGDWRFGH